MYDMIIIGGGPAGFTAAINGRIRNKSVLVLTNDWKKSPIYQSPRIENYPGRPGISGAQILDELAAHAEALGAQIEFGRVLNIMPMGDHFYVAAGQKIEQAKKVILAIGTGMHKKIPGEESLVGKGISYCATCDGMLYRNGKKVTVIGKASDAVEEANYLNEIGCDVTFVGEKPAEGLAEGISSVVAKKLLINGQEKVESVLADQTEIPCDAVFILRETVAPNDLFPSMKVEKGGIWVDRRMETSIPGVYAAGDCTGQPIQISKAMGEGQTAALSVVQDLDRIH